METINQFMVACGWIITIGGAVGVLYLEQRITSIETDIKDIKRKLNSDYNTINSQQDDVNLVMKSMFNLIENKITGNNIEGLKKTRDELINSLTTHEK